MKPLRPTEETYVCRPETDGKPTLMKRTETRNCLYAVVVNGDDKLLL